MKTPFYMTYPMQNLYQTEMEYERDMERMKELYPREVKKILPYIQERCDELEFEGSRIYDENPDRYMMEREAQRLYQWILQEEAKRREEEKSADDMESAQPSENDGMTDRNAGMAHTAETFSSAVEFGLHLPAGWIFPEKDLVSAEVPETAAKENIDSTEYMEVLPQEKMAVYGIRENKQSVEALQQFGPGMPPQGPGMPPGPGMSPQGPGMPPPEQNPDGCNNWLCSMVGVLFQDEIYRRRCRYRRCHRWW